MTKQPGVATDCAALAGLHEMQVRQLGASDAAAFLVLRLSGLQESPSAFGSSYEEEKDCTIEQAQAHLTGSNERVFFGCFQAQQLVGIVGVQREQGVKQRHIALVRSMYVSPESRNRGMGRRLLEAAQQQAAAWPGVVQITLAVTAGNEAAASLYRDMGFAEVGRLPRALCLDGKYFDELNMVRFIDAT